MIRRACCKIATGPVRVSKKYLFRKCVSFRGAKRRGNPFLKVYVLPEKQAKIKFFKKRIATPVCALARNDMLESFYLFVKQEIC